MHERNLAKRYAEALYEAVEPEGLAGRVERDLGFLEELLRAVPELETTLRKPVIAAGAKHAVIDRILGDRVGVPVISLLKLLVDKRREAIIPFVCEAYSELVRERRREVDAHVTSAVVLTDSEKAAIVARLSARTGMTIVPDWVVDPRVLAGVKVQIRDKVIDGTAASMLESWKERLIIGRS
jgi:F-type H+-transporting ATPase subunit delta